MKKFILIFALIIFAFSCKSSPDTTEVLTEETIEAEETADLEDHLLDDIPAAKIDSEIAETDQIEEDQAALETPDTQLAQVPEELPESEQLPAAETQPPAAPPAQMQPTPPVQIPPAEQTQPQAQLPAQTQPPTQTPAQTPAQTPTQTPPAPAVEITEDTSQRQVPAQTQQPPQRDWPPPVAPIREAPPTPTQSVVVPREGDIAVLPRGDDITFSRIVRATVGQIIEIPFRGTGWVYLGELASRRGIVYDSRHLDPGTSIDNFQDGQSFIFRAEEAGTYALKFFRHDFIRDYILNDHVQVIVGESPTAGAGWFGPPVDRGRVVAQPRWPTAIEEAEILRGGRPATEQSREQREQRETRNVQSASPPGLPVQDPDRLPPPVPIAPPIGVLDGRQPPARERQPVAPNEQQASAPAEPAAVLQDGPAPASVPQESREFIPPDQLIQRAKEAFEAGNAAAAIALLDQFAAFYPDGTDELYWLYGQFYEANTPSRNIKLSLEYYRRLVNEFPQSSRFNDARRRIAYLERFYINIQ